MSNLIRKTRQFKGISQEEMADLMNLSQSQYSRMENASSGLDKERLKQIAGILQTDMAQLMPITEDILQGFDSLYDKINAFEQEKQLLSLQMGAALNKIATYEKLFNCIFKTANNSDSFESFKSGLALLNAGAIS